MAGSHTHRVLNFLEKQGIAVKDKNTVKIDVDSSCDMAQVKVNSKVIMLGNFWDFRPEVHGLDLSFHGYQSLANVFVQALEADQKKVSLKVNKNWSYTD